jgi:uncharacterized membrane protein YfcA
VALRNGLLLVLAASALVFAVLWSRALQRHPKRAHERLAPRVVELALGLATNFLDALGVGSFATTTAAFHVLRLVPDQLIPGTLNVGHTLPTFAQALIYIAIVDVDITTLVCMILAAVLGAWIGAGVVASLAARYVRLGMGAALLVSATLILARLLDLLPPGGDAKGLSGRWLAFAMAVNFVLGAFMSIGVGLYAPCMVLVALLGMNPRTAFPIMMGSCAFLMPVASQRFVRKQGYAAAPALGLALGGIPGVLLAAYLVRELPLDAVRWLVVVVVVYTAAALLRAAGRD